MGVFVFDDMVADELKRIAALEEAWTRGMICVNCDRNKSQHTAGHYCQDFEPGEPPEAD